MPGSETPPYIYTSNKRKTNTGCGPPDRYRPARCGNLNPTAFLLSSNLGFVDTSPPGADKTSFPDTKSFHTSTTPTNRGRKRWPPGPIPPRMLWKPQPGVRRPSPALGEDKVPFLDHKSFHRSTTTTNRGGETVVSRVDIALHGAETPTWGSYFVQPAPPGEDKIPSPDHKSFHTSTTTTNPGRKRWSPESMTPRTIWKPQFAERAIPREDKRSADHESFHTSTTPPNREQERWLTGSIPAPHDVETPN